MENSTNDALRPDSCQKQKCLEMLQVVLDGQASKEQMDKFEDHLKSCLPCFEKYNVDSAIKELLKEKCCGGQVPQDLKQSIKNKIESLTF